LIEEMLSLPKSERTEHLGEEGKRRRGRENNNASTRADDI
jgi:hypothetical protein